MKQIKLNIEDENLEIVLTILNNLKNGLIKSIESSETNISSTTKYQPKLNKVICENEKPQGKYLSTASYKAKLQKNI
ncbi:hypothetical protein [Arcobacter cloacae]|uniref:Uncharacterized protein n=1 Tax=Arcobacter cloacae TaxID=1054034 RepID=A0A4Q0ZPI2_9BACT|nr:hypothetical protein [Arcobacter cloacae]QKF89946.1 hypothetical protein ACLO_1450 [Arcobacter cloacae]RXI40220.1 hypothetical protein CP963_09050 [Arcobacter cloacae]RXJ85518.1 hypothetical protein CRU90_02765 [Arcobacter cloacae]